MLNIKLAIIIDKITKIYRPSIFFLTGQINSNLNMYIRSLSYFDVEENDNLKEYSSIIDGNYVVFLDICLPLHPDLFRDKLQTIDESVYFQKMNTFFTMLEKITGKKVVIAAHPHSNYTTEFEHRICIKGKTALLTKFADYVILHESTSMNFALLNDKPLVFIYCQEFLYSRNYLYEIFERMKVQASYFDCSILNIDDKNIYEKVKSLSPTFNSEFYTNYLKTFVYSMEYPTRNFEIVCNELEILMNYKKKLMQN